MLSTSLFRWYHSPTRRTDRRVGRPQTSCCRPALEALEIRDLPTVAFIPLPPAPAGFPIVSSASARLDAQNDVFGTATYGNGSFPPQFKSEAFLWTATGGTQLLRDSANQPYSAVVDFGADGSILVRSNNADPYTSYFDLLSPGNPQAALVPLPPAPAGFPMVSSASARLDGQGDVFGTATYTNGGFPPQFKGEAFLWTADGGTQVLLDATNQPYSALVDLGTDGSILVRSNNADPYTSYFDLLSPGNPQASFVPLPPAPAGFPMVSSASAQLDGQGDVFGTATYGNGGFPPQFKGEAFLWTADGGTQLLLDAANQPYSAVVDFGAGGSILVRSNNADPYTSYFDVLSPDLRSPDRNRRAFLADPAAALVRCADASLPPDRGASGVVAGGRQTGHGQVYEFTNDDPQVEGPYLRHPDQAFEWKGGSVLRVLTDQTNYLLGVFDDPMAEAVVYLPAT
jgi:hypothetical protein